MKMYLPKLNSIILTASMILITLNVCKSNRYTEISFIDSVIRNFFHDEESLWTRQIHERSTPISSQNATLNKILDYFQRNINGTGYNIAHIDFVRTVDADLARHIENINNTHREAIRRLNEDKSLITQQFCEDSVRDVRNELSQIFDITKTATFLNYVRDNSDFCHTRGRIVSEGGEKLGLQNVIMDFYTAVPDALAKGYMTVQMAYMVLAIKNPKSMNQATPNSKSYEHKSVEVRQWFKSQHQTLQDNVHSIARNFSGEIWSCDDFNKPYSYTEITNFAQGYIENEVNFNVGGSCTGTCSDYRLTHQHGCRNSTMCHINYLDKNKTRCDGHIRSCKFIESDMAICPNEDDSIPGRRYNYVRYSSGLTLGRSRYCPDEIKAKSWIRWLVSCSYCFCYCDHDGPNSDRYFSLRPVISNIFENKVVTGLRLMKKGRIIHIFVAERKLDRNGQIFKSENELNSWIGDYEFVIEDSVVQEGVDYHKITWRDRAIELDSLRAPKGEVVTGARFRVVDNRLRFEIRTTEFNYETGYLKKASKHSVWRGNNHHYKDQIPIGDVDVPIRSPQKSKRHRGVHKYIEFTPTDIYKDIAQSTVPFIDTQEVEPSEPRPLSGAGIYYKSSPGYGGFIAPLIHLYDVENESF